MLVRVAFAKKLLQADGDVRVLCAVLEHRMTTGRCVTVLLATIRCDRLHGVSLACATDKHPVTFDRHGRQEVRWSLKTYQK